MRTSSSGDRLSVEMRSTKKSAGLKASGQGYLIELKYWTASDRGPKYIVLPFDSSSSLSNMV